MMPALEPPTIHRALLSADIPGLPALPGSTRTGKCVFSEWWATTACSKRTGLPGGPPGADGAPARFRVPHMGAMESAPTLSSVVRQPPDLAGRFSRLEQIKWRALTTYASQVDCMPPSREPGFRRSSCRYFPRLRNTFPRPRRSQAEYKKSYERHHFEDCQSTSAGLPASLAGDQGQAGNFENGGPNPWRVEALRATRRHLRPTFVVRLHS